VTANEFGCTVPKYRTHKIQNELNLLHDVPDVAVICNRQKFIVHRGVVSMRRYVVAKERVRNPDVIPDISTHLAYTTGTLKCQSRITPGLPQIERHSGTLYDSTLFCYIFHCYITRLAVNIDIYRQIHGYTREYIHVSISDSSHSVDISMDIKPARLVIKLNTYMFFSL